MDKMNRIATLVILSCVSCPSLSELQPRRRFGHGLDQSSNDVVRLHPLGLGVEVQKYPMSQDRVSKVAHVFDRNVVASVHHRSSFAAENQELRGSKRGAPVHPSL